jgi:hypothetical protein
MEGVILPGLLRGQGLLRSIGIPTRSYHPGDVDRAVVRLGPDLPVHSRGVGVQEPHHLGAAEPRPLDEVRARPEGRGADDHRPPGRAGGAARPSRT